MTECFQLKLLKKANELAFKDNIITSPLKLNEIAPFLNNLSNKQCELANVCFDLLNLESGIKKQFLSLTGMKLQNTIDALNSKASLITKYMTNNAVEVLYLLTQLSEETYLVGGAVRDVLINKEPKDFDFVTDTDMDTIMETLKNYGYKVKEAGKAFKVVFVSKGSEQFEIANFRKDGIYLDGRRPESVEIGDIYDDSHRRDFTVNALYFNFNKGLIDPTCKGIDDIISRTLRYIGNAEERIKEDNLRIFRFYRFIQKGFTPASKDMKDTRRLFNEVYDKIEPQRVRLELEKIIGV